MDKREAVSIARQYAHLVVQEINPDTIVLFGSTVNGTRKDDSDIDVAVIFDKFKGDWLGTYRCLTRMRRSTSIYVEPILLDRSQDRSGFAQEILRTGEVLFQR